MRNYNHYINFINKGVKVIFEENKYGSVYGILSNDENIISFDYFIMNGDLYYCSLNEYFDGCIYSYFEVYRALKDGDKFYAIGNKIYCTDPVKDIKANFKNLKKYIAKFVKHRTGYNPIFYHKQCGEFIKDDLLL